MQELETKYLSKVCGANAFSQYFFPTVGVPFVANEEFIIINALGKATLGGLIGVSIGSLIYENTASRFDGHQQDKWMVVGGLIGAAAYGYYTYHQYSPGAILAWSMV